MGGVSRTGKTAFLCTDNIKPRVRWRIWGLRKAGLEPHLCFVCLCWGLTSQATIFQSCRDGVTASWVMNQYFRGVKCLAQGHNTAAVDFEPPTSRSGVRHTTTEPPRSLNLIFDHMKRHVWEVTMATILVLLKITKFYPTRINFEFQAQRNVIKHCLQSSLLDSTYFLRNKESVT